MDIEQLTKSQIVLLTLLVSFVTSIATGIVTVSLMGQAPPTVTQTINRVVERTVERVVPEETQTATVITKERTVIVKESELIAQAVSRVSPSVVALHALPGEEGAERGVFIARGVVVAPGLAAVLRSALSEDEEFIIRTEGGGLLSAQRLSDVAEGSLALVSFSELEDNPVDPAAFVTDTPKLGQSIVALTGAGAIKVANGIVTAFVDSPADGFMEEGIDRAVAKEFETNIPAAALVPSSVVINTDGAVVGLSHEDLSRVIPSTVILALVDAVSQANAEDVQAQGLQKGVVSE